MLRINNSRKFTISTKLIMSGQQPTVEYYFSLKSVLLQYNYFFMVKVRSAWESCTLWLEWKKYETFLPVVRYFVSISSITSRFTCCRIIHNAVLLVFATDILNELVNSTVSDNDRSAFCMRVSMNVMSQPVSALYVTQYTPQYLHHLSVRVRLYEITLSAQS